MQAHCAARRSDGVTCGLAAPIRAQIDSIWAEYEAEKQSFGVMLSQAGCRAKAQDFQAEGTAIWMLYRVSWTTGAMKCVLGFVVTHRHDLLRRTALRGRDSNFECWLRTKFTASRIWRSWK